MKEEKVFLKIEKILDKFARSNSLQKKKNFLTNFGKTILWLLVLLAYLLKR